MYLQNKLKGLKYQKYGIYFDGSNNLAQPHVHLLTRSFPLSAELNFGHVEVLSSNHNSIIMDNNNICLMGESKPNLITH